MAVLKHLSSKNADYGSVVQYLMFQHDTLTGRPLIKDGHLLMRDEFLIDGVECSPANFDIECDELNRKYHKNQEYQDIKSHHYIISFDPKDVTECGLTMEKAQDIGLDFTKNNFPGHQAVVCTHADGDNHSGNIHVHIVINSLRKKDVVHKPVMERKCDSKAGYKHHLTNDYLEYLKKQVMNICNSLGLHQVDLLSPAKSRVTDKEQWAKARGQKKLDTINHKKIKNGEAPENAEFLTIKEELRRAVKEASSSAKSEQEFSQLLKEKYNITLKVSRGAYGYIHPDRNKPIRGRMLGTEYTETHLRSVFSRNVTMGTRTGDTSCRQNASLAHPPIHSTQKEPDTPSLLGKLHLYQEISIQQTSSQPEPDQLIEYLSRRKRIKALQESAEAVAFLQEKGYDSIDDLKADISDVRSEKSIIQQKIRAVGKDIEGLNEQLHYTGQYYARKTIYKEFVHSKDKAKFRATHNTAIREFEEARRWLHSHIEDGTLPTYNIMESEEGKFPGPRTVRAVRDKEIMERGKFRDEHRALKEKENNLNTILEKVEALVVSPAIDETIISRKRTQQSRS